MFESSRRAKLESVELGRTTHPGLWLEKYLRSSKKGDSSAKQTLVDEVIRATKGVRERATEDIRELYRGYFRRYTAALASRPGLTFAAKGCTVGRLSVGLGASAVLETSITLHRTYGVPYIPGSALKGLASSYAAKYWKDKGWSRSFDGGKTERGKLQELIFGTTDESGLVIFFDALPDPEGEDVWELNPDVITVHHPDYYQGKDKPPADWDSPTPVPFITARGTFHFFLGLVPLPKSELEAGKKVLTLAGKLLQQALEKEGVGAKTTIGYGRFRFDEDEAFRELEPPPPPPPKRSEIYERLASELAGLKWNTPPHELFQRLEAFSKLDEEEKGAFVEEHRGKLEEVLGTPKKPNYKVLKALKQAKDGSGLKLLAQRLGLL